MYSNRINALDSLRGIAALAVVIYHYTFRYNEIYSHSISLDELSIFKYGHLGVQLFFLISGFVIYLSLEKIDTVKQFAINRIARLYPAYWAAVILTFGTVLFFTLPGRDVNFSVMLMNLTMFQGFFGIPNVDGVYWTLAVELRFYVIIMVLNLIFPKRNLLIAFLILIVFLFVTKYIGAMWISNSIVIKLINFGFSSAYLHYFGAGIGFYLLHNKKYNVLALMLIFVSLLNNFVFINNIELMIVSSFYIIFTLLIYGRFNLLSKPIFIYFGSISYSLYLIHQNIGYIIINYSYRYGISGYFGIILALLVTITISHFMAKYFEISAGKVLKQKLNFLFPLSKAFCTRKS